MQIHSTRPGILEAGGAVRAMLNRHHLPRGLKGWVPGLDSLIGQSRVVETPRGKRVVKDYTRVVGVVKWLLGLLPPASIFYPYETSPLGRLVREEKFYRNPPRGVRVPRIIEVDYHHAVMVKEYVEGTPLNNPTPGNARLLGDSLGRIHVQDYCMGDTKPSNFLRTPRGEVAVIDAEQSLVECSQVEFKDWDLVLLLVFLSLEDPLQTPQGFKEAVSSLLESYWGHRSFGPRELRGVQALLLLMPPQHASVVRRIVSTAGS